MKYSLILTLVLMLNRCYSQSESMIAYYHKEKDLNHILLLGCNVGYSYSGPHLFTDEVFTYEAEGDKIIRHFDPEYSLRKRLDTLIINNRSLVDINGLSFKKTNIKKRDELIEKYILPSADAGFYRNFLEKISLCKEIEDIIGSRRFYFDGPHPDNYQKDFEELYRRYRTENAQVAELMKNAYEELLLESEGHGHRSPHCRRIQQNSSPTKTTSSSTRR